jgi:hypothetical protein
VSSVVSNLLLDSFNHPPFLNLLEKCDGVVTNDLFAVVTAARATAPRLPEASRVNFTGERSKRNRGAKR